jgi:hypothetical protein
VRANQNQSQSQCTRKMVKDSPRMNLYLRTDSCLLNNTNNISKWNHRMMRDISNRKKMMSIKNLGKKKIYTNKKKTPNRPITQLMNKKNKNSSITSSNTIKTNNNKEAKNQIQIV